MATDKAKQDEIQTLSGTDFVKNRFQSANQASAVYSRLKENSKGLATIRARLKSIYDGNAPYSSSELRRRGLTWMSNIDWGECRSIIRQNSTAVWNMFFSTENMISLTEKKLTHDRLIDHGMSISNAFTVVLRKWDDFFFEVNKKVSNMSLFGLGLTVFSDSESFALKSVPPANVYVSAKESMVPGAMTCIFVRDEIQIDVLVSMLNEAEATEGSGWNVGYTKRKIFDKVFEGQQSDLGAFGGSQWESALQIIKNGDPDDERDFDGINVVHLYVRELEPDEDGSSISHYIFYEDDSAEKKEFLYSADREYKDFQKALSFLFFEIGNDGMIRSVRGLGKEIYPFCEASNRLLNKLMDGVVQASGIIVTANSQSAVEKFSMVRKGNVTILPFDVTPQQQQMAPSIGPALQARAVFQNVQNKNVGTFDSVPNPMGGPEKSAAQSKLEARNEARFEANQSEWYYIQHQMFMREIFRRMLDNQLDEMDPLYDLQQDFYSLLDADNVPKSLRKSEKWNIYTPRAIGNGNPDTWKRITNEMVRLSGGLDEYGRHLVKREWFAARVGWENVDKFVPPYSRDDIPTLQHGMAESENVDMLGGHPRTVSVDDADIIHMNMHIKFAKNILDRFNEAQKMNPGKVDPRASYQALAQIVQHSKGHIAQMGKDETAKGKVETYAQVVGQLEQALAGMKKAVADFIKKQKQAQAEQQKKIQELQKKAQSNEEALLKEKNRHDERMRDVESQHEARMTKVMNKAMEDQQRLSADLNEKYQKLNADLVEMRSKQTAQDEI